MKATNFIAKKIDLQNNPNKAIIIDMAKTNKNDDFTAARKQMAKQHLQARGITDPAVLRAMQNIPREEFVPKQYYSSAYDDGPLPIGFGQTISQPYIVAAMTQALKVTNSSEVLEIGTGSGYQTAILANLAKKVYTIERCTQLAETAQAALAKLGIENTEFYVGDGSCGWPKDKKFDRIIITAAVPRLPFPVLEQLADGGIIVAPVGGTYSQDLVGAEKKSSKLKKFTICGCRFVKLIGKYGFEN